MKQASQLTSLQLSILRLLWAGGELSVHEVLEGLGSQRSLAFTTVATLLSRLDKRGIVARRREGRQYVYRALVEREEARRERIDELTRDLFAGDVADLVHHLLSRKEVGRGDLQRVRDLIEAREAEDAGQTASESGGTP